MSATPELKRVRFVGGPADGRELILHEETKFVVFPCFVPGKGISEVQYSYTGHVTHDYIEIWK
jgi:hypothetical protein